MNLDKTLESLERRARLVRRASLNASAVTIAMLLLANLSTFTGIRWVTAVLVVSFYLALIVAGVLLALYWHKYRPAVDRARSDLQTSMIADLQRQVAALSKRVDDQNESTST